MVVATISIWAAAEPEIADTLWHTKSLPPGFTGVAPPDRGGRVYYWENGRRKHKATLDEAKKGHAQRLPANLSPEQTQHQERAKRGTLDPFAPDKTAAKQMAAQHGLPANFYSEPAGQGKLTIGREYDPNGDVQRAFESQDKEKERQAMAAAVARALGEPAAPAAGGSSSPQEAGKPLPTAPATAPAETASPFSAKEGAQIAGLHNGEPITGTADKWMDAPQGFYAHVRLDRPMTNGNTGLYLKTDDHGNLLHTADFTPQEPVTQKLGGELDAYPWTWKDDAKFKDAAARKELRDHALAILADLKTLPDKEARELWAKHAPKDKPFPLDKPAAVGSQQAAAPLPALSPEGQKLAALVQGHDFLFANIDRPTEEDRRRNQQEQSQIADLLKKVPQTEAKQVWERFAPKDAKFPEQAPAPREPKAVPIPPMPPMQFGRSDKQKAFGQAIRDRFVGRLRGYVAQLNLADPDTEYRRLLDAAAKNPTLADGGWWAGKKDRNPREVIAALHMLTADF